ncbi:6097_t:CDS:2 [Cetraspora pellucida]|uniref:6097_t:CDS:1 n=1 Tax=Cetraspora pellucida TaxID=1433469 RepID=A0ACA9MRN0_9GLOM|nr:6097_t:CDS:2 [Cetraspora pellucida]
MHLQTYFSGSSTVKICPGLSQPTKTGLSPPTEILQAFLGFSGFHLRNTCVSWLIGRSRSKETPKRS